MSQPNKKTNASKVKKPYKTFPLSPHHGSGKWQKKIHGKIYYFGRLEDHESALQEYQRVKDFLHGGLEVPESIDELTIKQACNLFISSKKARLDSGEMSIKTYKDYDDTNKLILNHWGKTFLVAALTPEHFLKLREKLIERYSLDRMSKHIQNVRSMFKWLKAAKKIKKEMDFGPDFVKPSRGAMRIAKKSRPKKNNTREEILRLYANAEEPLKTMILLGINCALGPHDVATLEPRHHQPGLLEFPRPKTGINRVCPLWPETEAALVRHIEKQCFTKQGEPRIFVTDNGHPWVRHTNNGWVDRISVDYAKLRIKAGVRGTARKTKKDRNIGDGKGFYALRHTFRTIGDECLDDTAVKLIMGHLDDEMSENYRSFLKFDRLQSVTNYVRSWLLDAERGPIQDVSKK